MAAAVGKECKFNTVEKSVSAVDKNYSLGLISFKFCHKMQLLGRNR